MNLSLLGLAITEWIFKEGNSALVFIPVIFLVIYGLLIRPQRRKEQELQNWIKGLKKGEEIVTTGGLWGKVAGVEENSPYITVELQEKVRVRMLRSYVAGKAPEVKKSTNNEDKK